MPDETIFRLRKRQLRRWAAIHYDHGRSPSGLLFRPET